MRLWLKNRGDKSFLNTFIKSWVVQELIANITSNLIANIASCKGIKYHTVIFCCG